MNGYFTQKRKAFTLVELLIVIVVIGILSAMMMLSSSEAVSSAKATAIVSDLRNIKTAALAYFADHADTYMTQNPDTAVDYQLDKDDWLPYLNGKDFPNKGSYTIIFHRESGVAAWYAECNIGEGSGALLKGAELESVKKKLAGRAKSVGLLSIKSPTSKPYPEDSANSNYVFMLIE